MSFSKYGIYYQLPVYAFCDGNGDGVGDFAGILQKIDYLKSLHVNTLWLSPVHPAASYHGYDVLDYHAVRPSYEVGCSFDTLVQTLAKEGISVILDLVMNHTALSNVWFQKGVASFAGVGEYSECQNYYLFSWESHGKGWYEYEIGGKKVYYYGSFDGSMPDLNYREDLNFDQDPIFQEMVSMSKEWLARGVKGFRLDGATHFYMQYRNADEKNQAFLREYYRLLQEYDPNVYVVVETADGDYGSGYNKSVDSILNFPLYNRIRTSLLCSSGDIVDYAACCQQAYRRENPNAIMANFISNHDEGQGRLTMKNRDINQIKIALAFQILMPGNPFLYYGDELAMYGERSAPNGGYIDTAYRTPLLWTAESNRNAEVYLDERTKASVPYCETVGSLPFAGGNCVAEQEQDPFSVLNYVRKLTAIKQEYPILFTGTITKIYSNWQSTKILAYKVEEEGKTFVVLQNIAPFDTVYGVDYQWKISGTPVLRDWTHIGASKAEAKVEGGSVTLPAYSIAVLEICE